MKKNLLTVIVAVVLIIITTLFVTDGWIYSTTFLVAISIIKIIRHFNSKILRLTRWAKENPRKTQVMITVLQILILSLGLLIGYDLKELGLKLSGIPIIIFGVILMSGFLSIPFLPKRNTIALPVVVNKDRITYMSIALSAFVIMVITGNRIEDKFPNSFITYSLRSVDKAIFSQAILLDDEMYSNMEPGTDQQQPMLINKNSAIVAFASFTVTGDNSLSSTIHPSKEGRKKLTGENLEKKKKKLMKRIEKLRKAFAAGGTVGTVLLIILLVITSCAGICLIAIGGSAGAVAAGVVILGLSVWGFIKISKRKKRINTG